MRSRNDEPPEAGEPPAGVEAESSRFDEQPLNTTASTAAASADLHPRTPPLPLLIRPSAGDVIAGQRWRSQGWSLRGRVIATLRPAAPGSAEIGRRLGPMRAPRSGYRTTSPFNSA